jgi:hypothetical protein
MILCHSFLIDMTGVNLVQGSALFTTAVSSGKRHGHGSVISLRGGSTATFATNVEDATTEEDGEEIDEEDEFDAYTMLAKAVRSRFRSDDCDDEPDVPTLVKAFRLLSSSHKAFKGLDGAAHEAYQRTHATDEVDLTVSGRAKRSAARTAAVAQGLGACELCELIEYPERFDFSSISGTLGERQVLLNLTDVCYLRNSKVDALVMYEPSYQGGAGIRHGGIQDLTEDPTQQQQRVAGRILIVIGNGLCHDLNQMLKLLEERPRLLPIRGSQSASVHQSLYDAASLVLEAVAPILQAHNTSAIHFTGRGLSGGIASLAATILDGAIPMPYDISDSSIKNAGSRSKQRSTSRMGNKSGERIDTKNTTSVSFLQGFGRGRVSAIVIGVPPCLSANVEVPFVTSILYGDDIIGRVSPESLDRFYRRTRRAMQQKSVIGKKLNWMTDAASLASSSLRSHAFGGKDRDSKLAIPGRAYLVRPRRLGNQCSMHEIGSQLQGGRESLRAAFLWQLNDILLSRSLWKHHELDSYIHGLDRVHLRGFEDKGLEE